MIVYLWACSVKCSLVRQPGLYTAFWIANCAEPHPRDPEPIVNLAWGSLVITVALGHVFDKLKELQAAEKVCRSTFGDANSSGRWTTQASTIPQGQVCFRDEKTARVVKRRFSWNRNKQSRSNLGYNKLQWGLWAQDTCSSSTSAPSISYKDEQSSPLPGEVGTRWLGGGLQLMSPPSHSVIVFSIVVLVVSMPL